MVHKKIANNQRRSKYGIIKDGMREGEEEGKNWKFLTTEWNFLNLFLNLFSLKYVQAFPAFSLKRS